MMDVFHQVERYSDLPNRPPGDGRRQFVRFWFTGLAVVLTAWALVLTAPSLAQNRDEPADQAVNRVIDVRIASFRYDPDTLRIPAGQNVRLVFRNEGNFDHEFMAGRSVTDGMAGYEIDLFEGVEVQKSKREPEHEEKRTGTTLTIAPDSTQTLTFRLPPSRRGEWEMGCFLTNPALHYKAGMKGTIIVQ